MQPFTYSLPEFAPTDKDQRDVVAQWSFDVRPLLLRFHLYLQNVKTTWAKAQPHEAGLMEMSFPDGRIERLLALTAALTSLGTRLYGRYGDGKGKPKNVLNQIKKDADAISAYAMSESLWYLARSLPENHAIMVCLGEGLMPKGGETPEMGSNPQLGFGRVYARPSVAKWLDQRVVRLLNSSTYTWDDFYSEVQRAGITVWGAAIDTLENTSRFAKGEETGPMTILHVFDQPLHISKPYEGYMGTLILPKAVEETAAVQSVLLNYRTDRRLVLQAIQDTYPGIKPGNIHVWTLGGPSRQSRISTLWQTWRNLGVDIIDDNFVLPSGIKAFTDSGTYAPTYHVKTWTDEHDETHLLIVDGYAASAESMQAASLATSLGLEVSLCVLTSKFAFDWQTERNIMRLDSDSPDFPAALAQASKAAGSAAIAADDQETVQDYRRMIHEALDAGIPLGPRTLRADDFFPQKQWRCLSICGYMCQDPYTGSPGVTELKPGTYDVTVRLVSETADKFVTFTLTLMETQEQTRLIFNPLLNRFLAGEDYLNRPVRISDSGRIRNELQTLCAEALEFRDNTNIIVHFDRIEPAVISLQDQARLLEILQWYKERHAYWFSWLNIVPPSGQREE